MKLRTAAITPAVSAHLDMVRGIAALLVLTSHVRNLFFKDYQDLAVHRNTLINLIYGIGGLGHQAVIVFFVLSGFFIGGSVLSTLDKWSWKKYLIARLSRLYVVILPALVLGLLFDLLGHSLPAGYAWYDHSISHFNTQPFSKQISAGIFFGNLFFLQTILVPTFGTNSPLWSLANEFWYYITFPFLVMAMSLCKTGKRRLLPWIGLMGLSVWLPREMLFDFPIWVLGALIHFVPCVRVRSRARRLVGSIAAISAFLLISALIRGHFVPARPLADWGDLLLGLAFGLWLCSLVKLLPVDEEQKTVAHSYTWTARLLSGCSFSVYAIHLPLLIFIRSAFGPDYWLPTPENLLIGALVTLTAFLLGLAFSRFTEARTDLVRQRFVLLFDRPTPLEAVGDTRYPPFLLK